MPLCTTYAQFNQADVFTNAKQAAEKIRLDLTGFSPALVIFFASTAYDPATIAAEMHKTFPNAITVGCTSSGEGVDDLLLNGSVTAIAFTSDMFDFLESALVLDGDQASDAPSAFPSTDSALQHLAGLAGSKPIHLDYKKYVGFTLFDGICPFSEKAVQRLGELTNVNFVGGFAGDDYKFEAPSIFYKGRVYRKAGAIVLMEPKNGFTFVKTQAVEVTDNTFIVTSADEDNRIIWELDNRPAIQAYSEVVGVPTHDIGVLVFDEYPLALTLGGEPFLRAGVRSVDNRGMQLLASVQNEMRLTVCKAGDIISATTAALDKLKADLAPSGGIAGMIHINCASRHTALAKRHQEEAFGKLFAGIPNAGFSSYGEIFIGIVAMTSTMIVFKK